MIKRLIRKIKLHFDPPFKRDCYYTDPFGFIIGNALEQILHGMRTTNGDVLWEPVPSDRCYRLTIEMDSMPYYRCTSEVLVTSVSNPSEKKWIKRVQPKRILKEKFHEMILDGRLERV